MEKQRRTKWREDAFGYAKEGPILLALWITIGVIAYGIVLVVSSMKKAL